MCAHTCSVFPGRGCLCLCRYMYGVILGVHVYMMFSMYEHLNLCICVKNMCVCVLGGHTNPLQGAPACQGHHLLENVPSQLPSATCVCSGQVTKQHWPDSDLSRQPRDCSGPISNCHYSFPSPTRAGVSPSSLGSSGVQSTPRTLPPAHACPEEANFRSPELSPQQPWVRGTVTPFHRGGN
jgi:hypothetical protein